MIVLTKLTLLFLASIATTHGRRIKTDLKSDFIYKDTRVIGGTTAEEGFAPYQISLQNGYSGIHSCGGAIIDKDWVLTAAHCVQGATPMNKVVISGTNQYDKYGARTHAKEIYIHCNYDNPSMHNDIALLKLNNSIVFNEKTQPIPLPETPLKPGDDVVLTGWGSTVLWGPAPIDLQKITLKYLPHRECKENMGLGDAIDVGHMCTYTAPGEGACHGDSGGPLVSNGALVGLVNWGRPCAAGYPDANANVIFYGDWIRRIMSGNRKC